MSNLKDVIEETLLSCRVYQSSYEEDCGELELNNFFDLRQIEFIAIHVADKLETLIPLTARQSQCCIGCGDNEE